MGKNLIKVIWMFGRFIKWYIGVILIMMYFIIVTIIDKVWRRVRAKA